MTNSTPDFSAMPESAALSAPAKKSFLQRAGKTRPQRDFTMLGTAQSAPDIYMEYKGAGQERVPYACEETGEAITGWDGLKFAGIHIAEEVGSEKQTKLNVFFVPAAETDGEDEEGLMLTGGMPSPTQQGWWAQSMLVGLMELAETGIEAEFDLETYRGSRGRKPLFNTLKQGRRKLKNQNLYNKLEMARGDAAETDKVMRAAVKLIQLVSDGLEFNEYKEPDAPALGGYEDSDEFDADSDLG